MWWRIPSWPSPSPAELFPSVGRGRACPADRGVCPGTVSGRGGVPLVAERSIDVSCQLELPEDCRVAARAVCPEEVQGSLTDRGIEVRFPVDFRAEAAQRVKRVCVSAGKINTDAPKETTGAPSLVLRCLGKQETGLGSGETVQHHHRRDPGSQSTGDGRRYLPGPAAADPPEADLSHP